MTEERGLDVYITPSMKERVDRVHAHNRSVPLLVDGPVSEGLCQRVSDALRRTSMVSARQIADELDALERFPCTCFDED
jgi:hypothetical protein